MFEPIVDVAQTGGEALEERAGRGALEPQQPHGIEQDGQRAELVIDDGGDRRLFVPFRRRQQGPQPRGNDNADGVDAEGENHNILLDDADHFARQTQKQRQVSQRIAHEHNVAGLGGNVGASAAQGQADIGARQGGGVVDAVAHHADALAGLLPGRDKLGFFRRQHLGAHFRQGQRFGHTAGRGLPVARQEDEVGDTQRS